MSQGPGVLSVCLVGEVGSGGMGLVWSRHGFPGLCGGSERGLGAVWLGVLVPG
jgi:hypothetical protein